MCQGGWVSEWRRERGSFDIPIGSVNLSAYENVLLANGDIPEDELRKASSRLGFSRLRTVDPYLYRPYESATDSGGRGVC